ncbi:hypothetical protein JCM15519_06420 [Fundidesulfovibrio butyratiphilus]
MTNDLNPPLSWCGEFKDHVLEAAYRAQRLPETARFVRTVFACAVACNALFYANDLRYLDTPHFLPALAGRTVLVLISAACFVLASRAGTFRRLQNLCVAWCVPAIAACSVLVSIGTTVALVVIFLLPLIFHLLLPMSFRLTLAAGLVCGVSTLSAYLMTVPEWGTRVGLALSLLFANVLLGLVRLQSNRLRRTEWASTRQLRTVNRELSEQHHMLSALVRAVPTPLVVMSMITGRVILANDAARTYFHELMPDSTLDVTKIFDRKELLRLARNQPLDGRSKEFETRLRLGDGTWLNVLLATAVVRVHGERALLVSVVDITPHKLLEARLHHLASVDPLTGLYNRSRFFALADEEIRRAERYGRSLAVVMLDIDYFKDINDTFGHEAGDKALKAFARLCLGLLRDCDVVGRLGGEEFCLLLPETGIEGALAVAERLRASVAGMTLEGLSRPVTVSLGVSLVRPGEPQADLAVARADQALYKAKQNGRNRVELFESDREAEPAGQE